MNVNEMREKSRSVIGPYCKSCPICNGKACSNKIPGPGAKDTGTVAIKNYDAWQKIEVKCLCKKWNCGFYWRWFK